MLRFKYIWDISTDDISGPYEENGILQRTIERLGKELGKERFRLVDPPHAYEINPCKYRLASVPENRHWRRMRLAQEKRDAWLECAMLCVCCVGLMVVLMVFVL